MVAHDLNPLLEMLDGIVFILDGRVVAGSLDDVVRSDLLSRAVRHAGPRARHCGRPPLRGGRLGVQIRFAGPTWNLLQDVREIFAYGFMQNAFLAGTRRRHHGRRDRLLRRTAAPGVCDRGALARRLRGRDRRACSSGRILFLGLLAFTTLRRRAHGPARRQAARPRRRHRRHAGLFAGARLAVPDPVDQARRRGGQHPVRQHPGDLAGRRAVPGGALPCFAWWRWA